MEEVRWSDLQGFMQSKAVGATAKELVWLQQCWCALGVARLTVYSSDQTLAQVLLRACVLLEMLDEYKSLVLDTQLDVDALDLWQLLRGLNACKANATREAEWPLVAEALESHYSPSRELRIWSADPDEPDLPGLTALMLDMERAIGLFGDSILEHFQHPMAVPTIVPDEYEDMDIQDYVNLFAELKTEEIEAWFMRGMRLQS